MADKDGMNPGGGSKGYPPGAGQGTSGAVNSRSVPGGGATSGFNESISNDGKGGVPSSVASDGAGVKYPGVSSH